MKEHYTYAVTLIYREDYKPVWYLCKSYEVIGNSIVLTDSYEEKTKQTCLISIIPLDLVKKVCVNYYKENQLDETN